MNYHNKRLPKLVSLALLAAAASTPFILSHTDGKQNRDKMESEQNAMHWQELNWQELGEQTKTQDEQLAIDVSKMNAATGEEKLELLAAIVTKLVEQRSAMNERMQKMHNEMMQTPEPNVPVNMSMSE